MVRTTVQIDEALLARLRRIVPQRGISRFINRALEEKVGEIERRQIEDAMREGYQATHHDREAINREWQSLDAEGWPE